MIDHPVLRVRQIPFDIAKAFREMNVHSIVAACGDKYPGGVAWAFAELGSSMMVEIGEQTIYYAYRVLDGYKGHEQSDLFVKQELCHSGYHHSLNVRVWPTYRTTQYVPRVNELVYPEYSIWELDIEDATRAEAGRDRERALKSLYLREGAFESLIGIFHGFARFDDWSENFDAYLSCDPFSLYLWTYHLAEELEHIHVPLLFFEEKFDEKLWGEENFEKALMEAINYAKLGATSALRIAIGSGYSLSASDLRSTPCAVRRRRMMDAELRVGFDFTEELNERRHAYIRKYEEVFEPLIRERCEHLLDRAST